MMDDDQLTKIIIGCAYNVHQVLGAGFLEKVYENALRIELENGGLKLKQQHPIKVLYQGHIIGKYFADIWVEERIIVELKAVTSLITDHEIQLVNYLNATGVETGLLINFGRSVQVKRKFRVYQKK